MEHLLRRVRADLLAAADSVCLQRARLLTEGYEAFAHEPTPMKRARAFAHILQQTDLDLQSSPILAGNTSSASRAWMLQPEFGFGEADQVLIENDGLAGILDGAVPDDLLRFWEGRSLGGSSGIGHLAVDYGTVVHEGLDSIISRVRSCAALGDADARTYREAMVIALQAVIDWAGRYAEAAREAARRATDPEIRAAHLRVARACGHVPAKPARGLFEALQAIVLVHLAIHLEGHGMSVSIGLPDRVLAPFLDEGFDAEAATELIEAFMLKIAANSLYGRGSLTQAITVGGVDHEGRDCCNAITLCFLDACNRVRVGDPHVFLRWHEGISRQVKTRAAQLLASGLSMPLCVGDGATARGFEEMGVRREDAWSYCVIGCNELGIPGRCADAACATAGTVQYLGLLNATLEQPDLARVTGMPELLSALEQMMAVRVSKMREWGAGYRARVAAEAPTPFTSALMHGCVELGRDMLTGMQYRFSGVYERGLTNAANALAAIDELVFHRHELSLPQLVGNMEANWADTDLLSRVRAAPKWGNDDDDADRWALELVRMRERVLDEVDRASGTPPHVVCHVVRSLHHVDGKHLSASADGRRSGEPLADSIGAQAGTARCGPTAVVRSVLKLNASGDYKGGYNLNLTLPLGTGEDSIQALLETFFASGGQELQVACLDPDLLRAARRFPELHGDLLVRVAGFTARFVDLSRAEQDELMSRADAVAR